MIKPLTIPRGIANLFAINDSIVFKIPEAFANRPDLILDTMGQSNIAKEFANNYLSNTSPISLKTKDTYIISDIVFGGYFINGAR